MIKSLLFRQMASLCLLLIATNITQAQKLDSVSVTGLPRYLFWENHPQSFNQLKDSLVITAQSHTDLYRDSYGSYLPNNAPRLVFIADSNFILTAKIHHDFTGEWNAGALLLEGDSTNFIKFCFEKDNEGRHRVVSVVTCGYSDDCNGEQVSADDIYFKLAKAGQVIILYYSSNGKDWQMFRRLRFAFKGPLKAGFLAQGPSDKSNRVCFSDIRYSIQKITNPFKPE